MIFGIGTDIVEISRIKKLMETEGFLERCFNDAEITYAKGQPRSIAAMFSAKEAYSKALGTGIRGFSLKDITVLHDTLGKPYINAENRAFLPNSNIFLSLSHCNEYATAFVVIEKTL